MTGGKDVIMNQSSPEPLSRPTPQRPPGGRGSGCELLFGLGWTGFSLTFVIVPIAIFIAEWQTDYMQLYILIAVIVVVLAGVIVIIVKTRMR